MAATAVATTAVEPATTAAVEATTATVETIAPVEASVIATAVEAVRFTASVAVAATAIIAAVSVVTVPVVSAVAVEAMAIAAVEPGAGTDEDSTDEVIRSVVAVWSAGVRSVAVVTVGADRRRADRAVYWTYSHSYANLRVGVARGKKQNSQQSNIFKVTHVFPSIPA